ncbi:MAG: hypothetical protein ABEI98_03295 [Halorhabdus sp.]
MEYSTRLPAVHLEGETITTLEKTLLADCVSPEMEVEIDHGPVTYRYSSMEEIRHDVTLPDLVSSFKISLSDRKGTAELVAYSHENEFNLQLSGDHEWVETKRRSIEAFFDRHGARVRTFLERYMAFCLAFVSMGLGLLLYYSGFGGQIGMQSPADSLLFGSLALITGGILHIVLNRVYPYVLLVPTRSPSAYLTYLRQ